MSHAGVTPLCDQENANQTLKDKYLFIYLARKK